MGNRPINRRPWRKKPWSARKKRPTRWNAVTSSGAAEAGAAVDHLPMPYGVGPQLPVLTLVSGQVDVEPWADDQEVTLDRVVGDLNIRFWATTDTTERLLFLTPLIKIGLIVNEEVTQDPSGQTLDLWDQETMEDYEWMWMTSFIPEFQYARTLGTPADQIVQEWNYSIHLDIKNRRKIGQSDELNLYGSWRAYDGTSGVNTGNVEFTADIRQILMSR